MTIAKFISNFLICLTFLAFSMQLCIDFSTVNIAVNCMILISALITFFYLRWTKALDTHPLSSFAIFGLFVTSQLGALLAKSASWEPVIDRLRQPVATFTTLCMYLMIILVAHVFYRMITSGESSKGILPTIRSILTRIQIFAVPSVLQIWIMAFIGTLALLAPSNPIAHGMSFLAWMPFLIPIFVSQQSEKYCNTSLHYPLLFAHVMLIIFIGLIFNARQAMVSGFITVLFLLLLNAMRSSRHITTSQILKVTTASLFALALSWPVTDLMTAMVVARDTRDKVSTRKLIDNTFDAFNKPEVLEKSRTKLLTDYLYKSYDESYLNNPMLSRFVETKFHDNALYFASKMSESGKEEVQKLTGDILLATLPQPMLDSLKIKIQKDDLLFSMGDQLAHYAVGTPMSGFKVGSAFAHGEVLFGDLSPIAYFFIAIILFASMDILTTHTSSGSLVISTIGMLKIWPIFQYGLNADSLSVLFGNIFRVLLQSIILYVIVFYIAKLLTTYIQFNKRFKVL
jgi:hypothetical protein